MRKKVRDNWRRRNEIVVRYCGTGTLTHTHTHTGEERGETESRGE